MESLFNNAAGLLGHFGEHLWTASVAKTINSQNFIIICLKELKMLLFPESLLQMNKWIETDPDLLTATSFGNKDGTASGLSICFKLPSRECRFSSWLSSNESLVKWSEHTSATLGKTDLVIALILTSLIRALARKEKNSAFSVNWKLKCNWGSGGHCEPLSSFSEGRAGKTFGKFRIFSLKLVWYSLLEIIKLKLYLKYAVMFVVVSS